MRKPIDNRFKGKTAIVTGGSSGLGRSIAEELAKEGCCVVFCCLPGDVNEAQSLKNNFPGQVDFLVGDIAHESFCQQLIDFTLTHFSGIDYLVNNAFSFVAAGITASLDDWRRSLEVGPVAYARMASLVSNSMHNRGGGAIVNISSISAHIAQPHRWTYNASKGAVTQLTRCMAMDLAELNIRVNSVSPGWFWTRENEKAANYDKEKYEKIWGKFHLLKRMGQPHECAAAVLFLLSDDASFITGTDLHVDGGYNAMGPEGLGENTRVAGTKN